MPGRRCGGDSGDLSSGFHSDDERTAGVRTCAQAVVAQSSHQGHRSCRDRRAAGLARAPGAACRARPRGRPYLRSGLGGNPRLDDRPAQADAGRRADRSVPRAHERHFRSGQMIGLLLTARSLRAFADGYVAVLLPAYLLALGLGTIEVGVLSTVTMLGSAAATLAVGSWGNRFDLRALLIGAAALMALTGIGFAACSSLWPLLIVALAGTMNPGGGDVSVFYPLEHTALAAAAPAETRTSAFARYSFIGSLFGAVGALAAAAPEWLAQRHGVAMLDALKLMFIVYGAIGLAVGLIY